MAETAALASESCPACGAHAEWQPASQALSCGYCGTASPYEIDRETGTIREIDLVTTLRELPDDLRGWDTATRSVKCSRCHAISVFDPVRVGQNCDFCGSPELVDYDEIKAPIRPQSVLPFAVDETRVRETIRRWFAGRWLAPNALRTRALVDTVHGLYLPYWTFDAHVQCPWTAEAGTYYYTTETYRDSKGTQRTRQQRHTRWSPASGEVSHFFDDQPVPGSQGFPADLLRQVEPFPTSDLVPYDTAYLSGFVVEHYQVVLFDAAQIGRDAMHRQLERLCGSEVPGDTYRNLHIQPQYSGQTFKHILVPVWNLVYDYGSSAYQVLVNGYTGKMTGRYPKSPWKIAGLVAVISLLLLLIAIFSN
ncbi:MAG: zinc ribbon domain-containing protein [Acidobacteria bacterium]|nr:zinc ribbon domain-containing protein [Acidobacteriota bacterium]